jgi:putative ABC transport system ATP-binding protein
MSDRSGTAPAAEPIITLRGLVKTFEDGRVRALDGVDLEVAAGDFVAIMGPSGCGKSTLLNAVAALELADDGEIVVAGHDLRSTKDLDHFRARDVGLVFQLDNLLASLTAQENVEVAMLGQGGSRRERSARAGELLEFVDVADRARSRPPELSGGERQRVAIARALANSPVILLADEPTGRLDSTTSARVLDLLESLHHEKGMTLVVVTHDPRVAERAHHVVRMLDGRVVAHTGGEDTGGEDTTGGATAGSGGAGRAGAGSAGAGGPAAP